MIDLTGISQLPLPALIVPHRACLSAVSGTLSVYSGRPPLTFSPDRPEKEESMKLPVDTSSIAFLCALEPQPVLAFDTKQPRADENGEPLYVVQLMP
jgi:hypothetical protein